MQIPSGWEGRIGLRPACAAVRGAPWAGQPRAQSGEGHVSGCPVQAVQAPDRPIGSSGVSPSDQQFPGTGGWGRGCSRRPVLTDAGCPVRVLSHVGPDPTGTDVQW